MAFCVRFKRRVMVMLGNSAGAVASFAALALYVDERQIIAMNAAIRTVVAGVQSSSLDALFSALSWAGSVAVLGPMAAVAIFWLWRRGESDTCTGRPTSSEDGASARLSPLLVHCFTSAAHNSRLVTDVV